MPLSNAPSFRDDASVSAPSYNRMFIFLCSLIASLGGFLFGFDLGVITGVIPFIQRQFGLEGFRLGWVVALFEVGCMGGTLVTAYVADWLGRKRSLQGTAVWFIITTIGVAQAGGPIELALWRFLQGIGVGAASVLSPMYIAEIAPAAVRGRLVALNQLTIIAGILGATIACYHFGDPTQPESWRWMFGSALIPSMVFSLALFAIPESPRWLVKTGASGVAGRVLARLTGTNAVFDELARIRESLTTNQPAGSGRKLLQPNMRPLLMIGIGLALLQQFCGANNITGYLQLIFQRAGVSIQDGLLNAVFVMLVFLVFTVLAIALIDRLGRRKLLLIGTGLMAGFLFGLAWSFNSDRVDGRWVLTFVIGYIATFAFTLGPVVWVLLSEMFPLSVRSKALSLCSGVLWLATFMVVLISPSLLRLSPVVNFVFFGILNVIGFGFAWRWVPETKGRTLEELETLLIAKPSIQ